jgi:hypothetical protein
VLSVCAPPSFGPRNEWSAMGSGSIGSSDGRELEIVG